MRDFKKGHLSTEFYLALLVGSFGAGLVVFGFHLASSVLWPTVAAGCVAQLCGSAILIAALKSYVSSRATVKAAATSPTPIQGRGTV